MGEIVILVVLIGGFLVLVSYSIFVAFMLLTAILGLVRKIIVTTWYGPAYEFPAASARCRHERKTVIIHKCGKCNT